jgi:hypothetical protein
MNRCDYFEKMKTILDDQSTFTRIDRDPTIQNKDQLSHSSLRLKEEVFIFN